MAPAKKKTKKKATKSKPAKKAAAKRKSPKKSAAKRPSRRKTPSRRKAPRGVPRRATDLTLDRIRAIPAFACLSDEDANRVLEVSQVRDLAPGVPVFREGEVGDGLYAILEGHVRITKKNAKGGERDVATLDEDEVFGEMDLISDRPHTSTAKADGIARTFFLPKEAFQAMLKEGNRGATAMVIYLARMLAARLDENNQRMMQVLDRPSAPATSEFADFKRRLLSEWSF